MKGQLLKFLKQEKSLLNKAQLITESLLAIIIFLIVFIGFYNLMIGYLRNLNSTNDRIIANFLALEGIELVRAIRNYRYAINQCRQTVDINNNYSFCPEPEYTTSTWLGDLGDNNSSNITLCLNYNFSTSSCNTPEILYLNDSGFFFHTSTIPSPTTTKFKRLIIITTTESGVTIGNATSVRVISKVTWDDNSLELEGIIYNIEKIENR